MHTTTALKTTAILALFWLGCDAVRREESESATTSNLANDTRDLASVEGRHAAVPPAIDIQPANGALFTGGSNRNRTLTFNGFTTAAGSKVEVQILTAPDATTAEENWITIASATSSASGTTFNDPAPIFRWETTASAADRWPEGGLLRYRAITIDGNGAKTLLPFYDPAAGDCVASAGTKSWKDILALCKSPFSPALGAALGSTKKAAVLVSATREPGDGFGPDYLSRKGFISERETFDYYDAIDAPRTLEAYEERFGFFEKDDVRAVYYNLGDLGIGREMHCTTFDADGGGTACYVKNYGAGGVPDFSGDADRAMEDAVRRDGSFATVAMVKLGTKFAGKGNDVQFFVYDANDELVTRAGLDTVTSNDAIPNNCLNCHGGRYDRATSVVEGATFLPFDPEGFLFSQEPGFAYAEQEDTFRELNAIVRAAGATPATAQFVDGVYAGKPNLDWIPAGWSKSEEAKTVYRELYKPYCRTCHTSQVGDFAFMTYDDFKNEAAKSLASACDTNEMPVAEATLSLFWRSPARAFLVNALDGATACAPGGSR